MGPGRVLKLGGHGLIGWRGHGIPGKRSEDHTLPVCITYRLHGERELWGHWRGCRSLMGLPCLKSRASAGSLRSGFFAFGSRAIETATHSPGFASQLRRLVKARRPHVEQAEERGPCPAHGLKRHREARPSPSGATCSRHRGATAAACFLDSHSEANLSGPREITCLNFSVLSYSMYMLILPASESWPRWLEAAPCWPAAPHPAARGHGPGKGAQAAGCAPALQPPP